MTDDIKKSLKERSKLTKSYYKNSQQESDYTKKIIQAKNHYINKMTDKLQNPSTAPRTCWAILSHLRYNQKIAAIPPLLADGKFVAQIFVKRQIFLISFFHQYVHQYKVQVFYHLFYTGQMPE